MYISRIVRRSPSDIWEYNQTIDKRHMIYSKIPTVIFNFELFNEGISGLLDFVSLNDNYSTKYENERRYLSSSASSANNISSHNLFYSKNHSFICSFKVDTLQTNGTLLDYTSNGKGFKIDITANTMSILYTTEYKDYIIDVPFEYSKEYFLVITRLDNNINIYNHNNLIGNVTLEHNENFIDINSKIYMLSNNTNNNKIVPEFNLYTLSFCREPVRKRDLEKLS